MRTIRGRRVRPLHPLLGLALTFLLACAPDGVDEQMPEETGVPELEERGSAADGKLHLLSELDVGYGKVRFHRLRSPKGFTRVVVSESVPNSYRETPFGRLAKSGATHLELFRAIQPDGAAPTLLEGLHESEATDLGRDSLEVHKLALDRNVAIEKSSEACQDWVFEDPEDNCGERSWTNGRVADFVSGNVGLHVGPSWSYATTRPVTLGICNESDATIRGRIGIDFGGDNSSAYTYWGWATLGEGESWRWYDFSQTKGCYRCQGDDVCVLIAGCSEPSRYRVDGRSPAGKEYHLFTAEAFEPDCFHL